MRTGDRETLLKAVDVLGRPMVVFTAPCTMLSRTRSLSTLLASEPGRDALMRAATALARGVLTLTPGSPRHAEWESAGSISLCPHRRTYTLEAFAIPAGVLCEARGLVVVIERSARAGAEGALADLESFGFTKRQRQVAQLLLSHYSALEIAQALTISSHTARHHVEQVYRKAQVSGRHELRQRITMGNRDDDRRM